MPNDATDVADAAAAADVAAPHTGVFGREPVLYLALVKALVVLALALGLALSPELTAAILLLTEAVLAFLARGRVTPVVPPPSPKPGSLTTRHGDESDPTRPA